jgi:hypothetical protein
MPTALGQPHATTLAAAQRRRISDISRGSACVVEVALVARGVTTIIYGRSGLASNSPRAGIPPSICGPCGTEFAGTGPLSGCKDEIARLFTVATASRDELAGEEGLESKAPLVPGFNMIFSVADVFGGLCGPLCLGEAGPDHGCFERLRERSCVGRGVGNGLSGSEQVVLPTTAAPSSTHGV